MKVPLISLISIAIIIGLTVGASKVLEAMAPEAEKQTLVAPTPAVNVTKVHRRDVPYPLSSEGVVTTRRETILSAEVGGRIEYVHENFEVGARFQKGEVIASIDALNFQTAVEQADSAVADAKLALEIERAKGEQAAKDWARISPDKEPSQMVLRIPHLKSAEAKLKSTQANRDQALEDLERTKIRAPFDCRVREVNLNLGATVAPGTQLGMIYDPERVMVRLSFSMDDFSRIEPESEIELSAEVGGVDYLWESRILWDEGEVDRATLSGYVLAEIKSNPEVGTKFRLPPPGLFVQARFEGMMMKDVVVVPRAAVRGRDSVWIVDTESKLRSRTLEIVNSNQTSVYATSGIEDGDLVILNKIELPQEGMLLSVVEAEGEESPSGE